MSPSARLTVEIAVQEPKWAELGDLEAIAAQCIDAALAESAEKPREGAEVSLLFCDDARMHELNRAFRDKDKPTNVLSFPGPDPIESTCFLGDIALGYETIAREAREQGKSLDHHLRHMIVHGFLHLLGYDHEAEAEASEMEAMEIGILRRLGVENPYSDPLEHESDDNGRH
jgi:probable rRNA maturation factor